MCLQYFKSGSAMGLVMCGASLTDDQKAAIMESNKLDKILSTVYDTEKKIIKLLLLGTGESGKSTIFKQMQILYDQGFNDIEKSNYRSVLRRNIVECLQTLIAGARRFKFDFQHQAQLGPIADWIMQLDPLAQEQNFWVDHIVHYTHALWESEPAIKQTYAQRSQLQLLDSVEYLFEHVDRIGAHDYVPTPEDILRARLRTSGIVEKIFNVQQDRIKFLDVGGQRNERRKWIHCFEGVTAIIFVVAASEYDQTLFEDEKVSRMSESMEVWEKICNDQAFERTAMIVFFNKMDLFYKKVALEKSSIRKAFPTYPGPDTYEKSIEYIKDQFLALNKNKEKLIFPHYTSATDTKQFEKVFNDCKIIILSESLKKLGLE